MFENTYRLLDLAEKMGIPAMHVIINQGGKEVFNHVRGVSDEHGTPLTGNELYNIYSCSKFITCVAALKLFEEGKFSLDDNLSDYITAFGDTKVIKNKMLVKPDKPIKVKQLFTMTAGLTYDVKHEQIIRGFYETEGECPTVKMMDFVAKMPLAVEPGTEWRYSLGHDVLAALVEIISGKRFGEYVKEVIFDPCGMENSTFLLPPEKQNLVCSQYKYYAEDKAYVNFGKEIINYKLGTKYESGGAGCVSTPKDYMKFLEAVKSRKIISDDTIALMTANHLTDEERAKFWGPADYTYGLGVRTPLAGGRRTDYGWGGAAGAFTAIDEVNDITVYYSQHVLSSPFAPIRKDYIEAAKLDLGFDGFREDMYNGEGNALA